MSNKFHHYHKRKYSVSDYHNLISLYLTKIELLDFRCHDICELDIILNSLEDCYNHLCEFID